LLLVNQVLGGDTPPGLSSEDLARRAESEFSQGVEYRKDADRARPHFQAAAQYYEELRGRGGRNSLLFANLGNSYLLAGDLPRAIFTYRQGLKSSPGNQSLRRNLAEARAMVAYPGPDALGMMISDKEGYWYELLGPQFTWCAAALCYASGCIFLTRWWLTGGRFSCALGFAALIAALGISAYGYFAQASPSDRPLIVVAEDSLLLRKGDSFHYPPRYETPVNQGVEAQLLFDRGAWLQIELAGGEVGWVPRKSVLLEE
jgi:hypothetical protein